MTSFLKGLFYFATMLVWFCLCVMFFTECLGTEKHIIRDFPKWIDFIMLMVSLSSCAFCMWNILNLALSKRTVQPTRAELLIQQMNKAIEEEDYELATKIRNKLKQQA